MKRFEPVRKSTFQHVAPEFALGRGLKPKSQRRSFKRFVVAPEFALGRGLKPLLCDSFSVRHRVAPEFALGRGLKQH